MLNPYFAPAPLHLSQDVVGIPCTSTFFQTAEGHAIAVEDFDRYTLEAELADMDRDEVAWQITNALEEHPEGLRKTTLQQAVAPGLRKHFHDVLCEMLLVDVVVKFALVKGGKGAGFFYKLDRKCKRVEVLEEELAQRDMLPQRVRARIKEILGEHPEGLSGAELRSMLTIPQREVRVQVLAELVATGVVCREVVEKKDGGQRTLYKLSVA